MDEIKFHRLEDQERIRLLLARIRNKQLMLAQQGRVSDSARYAERAMRLRERSPEFAGLL